MRPQTARTSLALAVGLFAAAGQCADFEFVAVAAAAASAALGFKLVNHIKYLKREVSPDGDFHVELGLDDIPQVEGGGNAVRAQRCLNVPADIPTYLVDNCCKALSGATITASGSKSSQKIRIDGLPYDCISLAPWFDNVGNVPYACGDACLEWAGLSSSSFDTLANTLAKL
ncbi:hypothetical protein F4820DRAFT_372598 [Hypoxylon rubiginosum]|uniref:Uncharacterized protein n=1 Tax=Hypoxylon rubiginosum TaxID=110542 RepID=A0ACB9YVN3_9PEZI|nr:hypothetical protein F4820DRAFT_372598 [Hypoxylon rubiginosum]